MISELVFSRTRSKIRPAANLTEALGDRTGIVRSLREVMVERDDPRVFNVIAVEADIHRLVERQVIADIAAAAAGFTPGDAAERAIGEALERYALSFYDPETIVYGSYNELASTIPDDMIDPESMGMFTPEQYARKKFPFFPFTRDTRIGWGPTVNMVNGRTCYFPAQVLHFGYHLHEGERPISFSTSNGCAAGPTATHAALKGCLEAMERDPVMLTWFRRVSPPHLDIAGSELVLDALEHHFAVPNVEHHLLLLDSGLGIPTVMCVVLDPTNPQAHFVMGAACHPDPQQAAIKAMLEAGGQGRPYLKFLAASRPRIARRVEDLREFPETLVFYGRKENYRYVSFLLDSTERIPLASIPNLAGGDQEDELRRVVSMLASRGFTPYVADLTTADLRQLGVCVLRVLVPGLAPFCPPDLPLLCHPRFLAPGAMAGLSSCRPEDLNPLPHPFP